MIVSKFSCEEIWNTCLCSCSNQLRPIRCTADKNFHYCPFLEYSIGRVSAIIIVVIEKSQWDKSILYYTRNECMSNFSAFPIAADQLRGVDIFGVHRLTSSYLHNIPTESIAILSMCEPDVAKIDTLFDFVARSSRVLTSVVTTFSNSRFPVVVFSLSRSFAIFAPV